jgi:uncharacterized membrane protein
MTDRRSIGNMLAPPRFLAFLAALLVCVPVATARFGDAALGAMGGFDLAAILFLALCFPLLRISDANLIRAHAKTNDANRTLLLVVTVIVLAVLLIAVAAETVGQRPQPLSKILIVSTLALAWLFSNTVYAFHYAHLSYLSSSERCDALEFPGTPQPGYWDFVYFAFTLGMTFQTSDVAIHDERIRRVVTMHSFAAFVFNIGVLAFTINVLGSG